MSTTSKPNNHNLLFSPISEKKVALRKIAITTLAGLFSLHVCAQSTQEKRENYLREALEINIAKDHRHDPLHLSRLIEIAVKLFL